MMYPWAFVPDNVQIFSAHTHILLSNNTPAHYFEASYINTLSRKKATENPVFSVCQYCRSPEDMSGVDLRYLSLSMTHATFWEGCIQGCDYFKRDVVLYCFDQGLFDLVAIRGTLRV